MNRRMFLAACAAGAVSAQTGRKKNVLFLAADDMNNALGCYGHKVVKSPNIDRLAARGVRFDRAYCQFPLCGPSRASLMTGKRPDVTKVLGNNIDFRDHLPDTVTLPELFKNNGWYAAREGKMFHMNVPGEVTLPRFQDERSWHHSVSPGGPEAKTPGELHRLSPPGTQFGMQWLPAATGDGQSDSNAAERAIALLEKHRNEPFFLGVGFLRPHLPFVAPAKFYDRYPLDTIPLPENRAGDLDDIPAAAKGVRPFLWNHMGMSERQIREARRGYYASTSFMDEQLGRVLDALERLKLAENTIVVFWGDHGWNLGEHTRWQKMSLMEDSARVPLIVSAPGSKGNGKSCMSLVEFVDLYPTLAELCGLKAPGDLEGQSMARLLEDPARPFKKAAFTQIAYEDITGRAMRTARYRYIRWEGKGGGEELYDHRTDAGEFTNLALQPSAKGVLEQQRKMFDAGWRAARA
ncbi:MAG: sulfatase [Bryobacterales bacterium]|nr:sulfatase [Bryobacterales bacterium]